jgi:hypothetical protein
MLTAALSSRSALCVGRKSSDPSRGRTQTASHRTRSPPQLPHSACVDTWKDNHRRRREVAVREGRSVCVPRASLATCASSEARHHVHFQRTGSDIPLRSARVLPSRGPGQANDPESAAVKAGGLGHCYARPGRPSGRHEQEAFQFGRRGGGGLEELSELWTSAGNAGEARRVRQLEWRRQTEERGYEIELGRELINAPVVGRPESAFNDLRQSPSADSISGMRQELSFASLRQPTYPVPTRAGDLQTSHRQGCH